MCQAVLGTRDIRPVGEEGGGEGGGRLLSDELGLAPGTERSGHTVNGRTGKHGEEKKKKKRCFSQSVRPREGPRPEAHGAGAQHRLSGGTWPGWKTAVRGAGRTHLTRPLRRAPPGP